MNWTSSVYEKTVRHVEDRGKSRLKARGVIDDADFLMGALAAMEALGLEPNKWPARWIFGLIGNESPLRDKSHEPQKEVFTGPKYCDCGAELSYRGHCCYCDNDE